MREGEKTGLFVEQKIPEDSEEAIDRKKHSPHRHAKREKNLHEVRKRELGALRRGKGSRKLPHPQATRTTLEKEEGTKMGRNRSENQVACNSEKNSIQGRRMQLIVSSRHHVGF